MALFWAYLAVKSLMGSLSRRLVIQRSNVYSLFIPALSYTLSLYWEQCVNKFVPKPYLDEVFHIRQAQAYCHGNYTVWDPKITTPPALAFSKQFCSIHQLRLSNCHALLLTFYYAHSCRRHIVKKWARNRDLLDVDALHTAFNITLFPPLFFFSGLFYTDVLSICCVLVSYKLYLERNDERTNLRLNLLCSFIVGILCLLIRQTNIFWVAIFLGALQLVETIKLHQIKEEILKSSIIRYQFLSKFLKKYCIQKLHDPSLEEAGDKSNHVATIHLPQILYLWPLITFFSAPLLIPAGISFFRRLNYQISRHVFISISRSNLQSTLHITGGLILCLATIKYNTIIHPFTLADNRHYMFYIFRYTILRHPAIRFLLAPIYAVCSALPRYFITPWVLWRLNIPMNVSKELVSKSNTSGLRTNNLVFTALNKSKSNMRHNKWLWLETTWLILINLITGFIFLHKGFEWPQEPGNVQRFMW
ncbi:Bgt-1168 [Blumeria graminis f. sp. tritici]|uniref:Dol-P-Glc:Glc(2)Man(9)GlcNAc(2)-PP-Dol alpha-1,2-glucosyltransferase n=2 Tax=Blumeria graminis f. sp. tritici TaxID=62690 RepID=A0A381L3P6_BLUGR|nr:Dolichyl-phosphoglucose-dependent alpha-12 glucosyltransferase [Blumeria graminis f. sp. tritici 96224]VDB86363.1 Bgt-1168 [Blumeria graminis f. sp. tritici]